MPKSSLPALVFNGVSLSIIRQNNQTYFSATDIAKSLGYQSDDAISRIYRRNSDEFTKDMSETVKLTVSENIQKTVRLFSLRGAHLVAMFSRTSKAKEFRRWVLDILDREAGQQAAVSLPAVRVITTEEQTAINMRAHVLAQEKYKVIRNELMADYLAGRVDDLDKWTPTGLEQLPFNPVSTSAHEKEVNGSVYRSRRYLMHFDHEGKPIVYGLDNEEFVTSARKLSMHIREGSTSPFDSLKVAEILQACADRLAYESKRGRQ